MYSAIEKNPTQIKITITNAPGNNTVQSEVLPYTGECDWDWREGRGNAGLGDQPVTETV